MHTRSKRGIARLGFVMAFLPAAILGALWLGSLQNARPAAVWYSYDERPSDGRTFTVTFSTGSLAVDRLGDRIGGEFDKYRLVPVRDALTLTAGVPTTALVNLGEFTVGVTGDPIDVPFVLSRTLTINDVTQDLDQPARISTGITTDHLFVEVGETVSFEVDLGGWTGIIDVTPQGQAVLGTVANETDTEALYATFLLRNVRPGAHARTPGRDVTSAAFSPDGRIVTTTDADGVVRIWDSRNGTIVRLYDRESLAK